jgi:tetratricopeptide (TPR) repeat protein
VVLNRKIILVIIAILICSFSSVGTVYPEEERLLDNWYHYEQGMRMIEAKNWRQAQTEFTYYLNHPEIHKHMFGAAYFGRGLLYQAMGKYDQAIEEFRLAIQHDLHPSFPVSENAYLNIGAIFMKGKAYQDAIHTYSKVVEINPKNGFGHYYLGLAYLKTGDYEKAAKEAEEAKKLGVPFTALSDELKKVKDNPSKEQGASADNDKGASKKKATNNSKVKKN